MKKGRGREGGREGERKGGREGGRKEGKVFLNCPMPTNKYGTNSLEHH